MDYEGRFEQMKKLLLILAIIILFFIEGNTPNTTDSSLTNDAEDSPSIFEKLEIGFHKLIENIDLPWLKEPIEFFGDEKNPPEEDDTQNSKDLMLDLPDQQSYSIYNIEIGDGKDEVEKLHGEAKRISLNEYGTDWHIYHDNYRDFFMVAYDENEKVAGIYTNHEILSSVNGITIGTTTREEIESMYGKGLDGILKNHIRYLFPEERDFEVYFENGNYITFFFDKFENNTLTAIQIISETLEERKQGYYGEASNDLMEGFELQLYDLTNATRVLHGLEPLSWDEHVRVTARKHSQDMAENNYFSHTSLDGKTPFDRMKEDDIFFLLAGENLAYGQFSSIFAHEGLMNSEGHRENILQPEYEFLGVGVAFNNKNQPFFTENFYAK